MCKGVKEKYYFKRMDKINKITEHFQLIINE